MRNLIIGWGSIVILLLSSLTINAQEPSNQFFLKIVDANNESILGATIHTDTFHFHSDKNGLVSIPYSLRYHETVVNAIGFEPTLVNLKALKTGDTIEVVLPISRYSLDQIEIAGHKQWENTLNTIERLDIDAINKKTGLSLGGMIENVRGVHLLKTGATIEKPMIHGLHSQRVAIINQGVKQKGQEWGAEHAPEIDPYGAGEIKVIKGAEAVKYGYEAMGGVIIMEPPILRMDTSIYGSVRLSTQSNGRWISGALKLGGHHRQLPHFSWMIQTSAKKSGNLKTADYYLDNTGVNEMNVHAYLNYTREHFQSNLMYSLFNTQLGILKSSHIGSLDDLLFQIEQGRPSENGHFSYDINAPRQAIKHHLLKWRNHIHLSDFAHFTAQYAFQWNQRKEFDIRRVDRSSIPSLDLSLKAHDIQLQLEWIPHSNLDFDIGIFASYQENENIPGSFTTPLIPDFIQQETGFYGIGTWSKNKWSVQGGIRGDYLLVNALGYNYLGVLYGDKRDYKGISASLSAAYELNNHWSLSISSGNAWRPPQVNELYSTGLHHGSAAFELGDENLKAEHSWKNMLSLKWKPLIPISIEIEAFSHLFEDYIYLQSTHEYWESLRGVFPIYQYQQSNAHLYGLDFTGEWEMIAPLNYQFQASFIKAKNLSTNGFLPQIPSQQFRHSLQWSLGNWKGLSTPYVKLEHVWVGKQKDYEVGLDFVAPPDAYHLFNFSLGTKWHIKQQSINVDIAVQNLTNQLYKDYLNRFRYYTHDLGRTIQLRINYEF